MQKLYLHALPEPDEEPWTVDYFSDKIDNICRSAALELHRKSLMVEEAVEEILNLVRKARIECENSSGEEIFFEGNNRQSILNFNVVIMESSTILLY